MKIDKGDVPSELIECDKKHRDDYLKTKTEHNFKNSCYAHKKVKEKLQKAYSEKCCYCNSDFGATSYINIEHYRPKSIYYWLGYEWDNLLHCCSICNTNKSNKFPVENEIEIDIDMNLDNEKPLILNPEKDNLLDFYEFNIDGEIFAKNSNKKAEKTIEICKLERIGLLKARKRVIDSILRAVGIVLEDILKNISSKKEFKSNLKLKFIKLFTEELSLKNEYYLMFNYFLLNFDEVFEELYKKIIKKYL